MTEATSMIAGSRWFFPILLNKTSWRPFWARASLEKFKEKIKKISYSKLLGINNNDISAWLFVWEDEKSFFCLALMSSTNDVTQFRTFHLPLQVVMEKKTLSSKTNIYNFTEISILI